VGRRGRSKREKKKGGKKDSSAANFKKEGRGKAASIRTRFLKEEGMEK